MVRKLLKNSTNIFTRQQTNILSAATVITGAVLLAAITGVIRNRLLNAYFYTPQTLPDLDAYWAAFRIPDLVFQLLVIGALSAAFIPVFSRYIRQDKKEAYHLACATTTLVLTIFTIFVAIIFAFARPLSAAITQSFSPDQITTMANLTRIMVIAQLFFAVSNFLTGIIQAQQRFLIPALSPLMYNLGIIAGTVGLHSFIGIYGPAVGVVLGAFLHLAIQWPLSQRLGFRLKFVWDPLHHGVRKIARLMLPRTLALAVTQVELTVVVYIASALTSGSLTIFYLAQQLMNLPVRLFGLPIGQASFPFLAQETAEGKRQEFKQTLIRSLLQILYIALPASAILIVLRIPLVRLAYGVSNFPWPATVLTGKAVAILVVSAFAQAITQILIRGFYALHNTKTPLVVATISTIINIAVSFALVFYFNFGILGLAIALSLSNIIQGISLLYLISRELGGFERADFTIPFLKISFATLLTGVSLWVPFRLLDQLVFDTTRTGPLIALTGTTGAIGLGVYLAFSKIMNIKQLHAFTQLAYRIGNWRKIFSTTQETLESPHQPQD